MTGSKPRARHVFLYILVVVLPAAVAGCGSKTGTVEGKVSVDGRPANGGIVIFSGAEGRSSPGTIHEDGTYQADDVPVGPVKVAIMPDMRMGSDGSPARPPLPGTPAAAPSSAAVPVLIPRKYTKVDTSGLTLTVQGGKNSFDIVMTSK
ncbi:MAG TPA: hypothetical protein VMG10_12770 [Gemmataceae bacterium]|nr:hypothetical protein [Gemmataceae bacterium]